MLLTENGTEAPTPGVGLNWYALYTRHQHEKAVAQILTNKGLEVFLPLYSVAHRWQDRTKQLWLPLFPCYVFLQNAPGG
jgi:transcription termination/antitermination protein NusG